MNSVLRMLGVAIALTGSAFAQWSATFARPSTPLVQYGPSNLYGAIPGIAAFDDGNGSRLYALRQAYQGQNVIDVVRWTGARWDSVFTAPVAANFLAAGGPWVASDGGVPVLLFTIAGGSSTYVWRFDGTTWSALADIPFGVLALASVDLGSGPVLFAVGSRSASAGVVASWDGSAWNQLGPDLLKPVGALASYDDGSGLELFIGSRVSTTGALAELVPGSAVASWNGAAWQAVGAVTNVNVLRVYGGDLYLGRQDGLRRLTAGTWTPVPGSPTNMSGVLQPVTALTDADLGAGARLALGANSGVYLFDGSAFTQLGSAALGVHTEECALAQVTELGQPRLYVSGVYKLVDGLGCLGLASTDGSTWSTLGAGLAAPVATLAAHTTLSGEQLFAAGEFESAGYGPALHGSGRWDGSAWIALGQFTSGVNPWAFYAFRSLDLGGGPELYGGGKFILGSSTKSVARWTGTNWSALPTVGGFVHALCAFDAGPGPELIAGGVMPGSPQGNNISRYDGTAWNALGTGTNGAVGALETYVESGVERLFAGGSFTTAGGITTGGIARWDGSVWSNVGSGVTGNVSALCVFDDGVESALYAGGTLTNVDGNTVANLARWNGSAWSDVPDGGANGPVYALRVHDDGRGPALYAGGSFSSIGGITAYSLARFDGTQWEAVDGGIDGVVVTLASADDDGDGDRELFVGGEFQQTATVAAANIARLEGRPHYTSFCAGDGQYLDHTTPCPCGNDGAAGRGCASSFVADGALLEASGSTANDTLVLHVIDTPQSSLGIYLQHDAQDDRVFHDGVLCASGNLIRLRRHFSVGGESMFPDSTDTTTIAQRGSVTPGSGATRFYSCFYRNASTTFCPPATANVSNGIRVIW